MGLTQKLGTIPLAIQTDSSNNVGIGGAANASYKLDVIGTTRVSTALTISSTTNAGLIAATNSTTGYTYLDLINNGASGRNYQIGVGGNAAASGYANNLYFDLVGVGNIMTLTSGRNVGIGTSSPTFKLDVIGGIRINEDGAGTKVIQIRSDFAGVDPAINVSTNNALLLQTNNTERMRITSGGEVCVRATAPSYSATGRGNITIGGASGASTILAMQINGNPRGYFYCNPDDTYIDNYNGTGGVYVFNGTGGVYVARNGTSWTSNSDERLKNITGNIENAVDSLMTLRTIKHTWKIDNNNKEHLALIAQDVEKVFPQVIDKSKLPSKPNEEQSDDTEYLGVRYQELVPVLVKAIQELNAKVTALENK